MTDYSLQSAISRRPLPPPVDTAGEKWYTIAETALLLHRSRRTILNLIYQHNVKRRLIRQGRHPRRIMVLSEPMVLLLRSYTRT